MVRASVKAYLIASHVNEDAVVVEELPAHRGAVRLDLAVVNGRLSGIEIKSDCDHLGRLGRQAELFSLAADRMTLVVGESHRDAAMAMIPDWWAITLATLRDDGCVRLRTIRKGRLNRTTNPCALVHLLEREEMVALLEWHDLVKGYRTAGYAELADRIVVKLSRTQIATGVRRLIKIRAWIEKSYSRSAFGRTAVICGKPVS